MITDINIKKVESGEIIILLEDNFLIIKSKKIEVKKKNMIE